MLNRYLKKQVEDDLKRKMVFVGGPRQVGKTTLALDLVGGGAGYLNWDAAEHREQILRRTLPDSDLLVFDEIHKYRSWRNYIKGLYDVRRPGRRILVTGSARLDWYRFGGDSLQGRYHYLRLFPLSFAEIGGTSREGFFDLLTYGPFPEPFFGASETQARRWSREYRTRLIHDDLRSLENVRDIGNLELMMLRLPDLVGSPLSINALREDLQVSHKAVSGWLDKVERLYAIFRLPPFGAPKIRAVKKERKHYHFDWTLVKDPPKRFENAVALHLLKWIAFQEDTLGKDMELRYFRDIDGREVDFVVLEDRRPLMFIECKWSDAPVSAALGYLKTRFPDTSAFQLTAEGEKDYVTDRGIRVCPAHVFLEKLV